LLKIADEEAEHLKELIDNAVDLARLDEAHIDVQAEMGDLGKTVQEVITSMRGIIDGRSVTVNTEPQTPMITFDRRLTKLAIKQVLDNALKYSPPETSIEVRVSAHDDMAFLEITDHGNGIAPEEQPRIFQRFYRSPSVRKQIPGSGLGLSIANHIMQAHGGDLTVRSEPGRTTFSLKLPLYRKAQAK